MNSGNQPPLTVSNTQGSGLKIEENDLQSPRKENSQLLIDLGLLQKSDAKEDFEEQ